MSFRTVELRNVKIIPKIEKNKDGQIMRTIEIHVNDKTTIVEIDIVDTTEGHSIWNWFSTTATEDILIYVEGGSANIPCGYVTIAFITISYKGKKSVARILARKDLKRREPLKPYLDEIKGYGNFKIIYTRPSVESEELVGVINVDGNVDIIKTKSET